MIAIEYWCMKKQPLTYADIVNNSAWSALYALHVLCRVFFVVLYSLNHVLLLFVWSWWCNGMKSLSALLALCKGNPPVIGPPSQRLSDAVCDITFDVSWTNWWTNSPFAMISDALTLRWRHSNVVVQLVIYVVDLPIFLWVTSITPGCRMIRMLQFQGKDPEDS